MSVKGSVVVSGTKQNVPGASLTTEACLRARGEIRGEMSLLKVWALKTPTERCPGLTDRC